jgi:hypothetical protein
MNPYLQGQVTQLANKFNHMQDVIQDLEMRLQNVQQMNPANRQEMARYLVKQFSGELDDLRQYNQQLLAEIQRAMNEEAQRRDNADMQLSLEIQEGDKQAMEQVVAELEQIREEQTLMTQEIQRLFMEEVERRESADNALAEQLEDFKRQIMIQMTEGINASREESNLFAQEIETRLQEEIERRGNGESSLNEQVNEAKNSLIAQINEELALIKVDLANVNGPVQQMIIEEVEKRDLSHNNLSEQLEQLKKMFSNQLADEVGELHRSLGVINEPLERRLAEEIEKRDISLATLENQLERMNKSFSGKLADEVSFIKHEMANVNGPVQQMIIEEIDRRDLSHSALQDQLEELKVMFSNELGGQADDFRQQLSMITQPLELKFAAAEERRDLDRKSIEDQFKHIKKVFSSKLAVEIDEIKEALVSINEPLERVLHDEMDQRERSTRESIMSQLEELRGIIASQFSSQMESLQLEIEQKRQYTEEVEREITEESRQRTASDTMLLDRIEQIQEKLSQEFTGKLDTVEGELKEIVHNEVSEEQKKRDQVSNVLQDQMNEVAKTNEDYLSEFRRRLDGVDVLLKQAVQFQVQ